VDLEGLEIASEREEHASIATMPYYSAIAYDGHSMYSVYDTSQWTVMLTIPRVKCAGSGQTKAKYFGLACNFVRPMPTQARLLKPWW
jgi:hypothetical protein